MTHVGNIKGVLNMIDRCEFHADILNTEIERSGDVKLRSPFQGELLEHIRKMRDHYLKKFRSEHSKGGSNGKETSKGH